MEDNHLEVPQKPTHEINFRDDLREPTISWGHCAITGEWAPVIGVDLGDICIEAPVVDEGVIYDPESGDVKFTVWRPAIFEQQLTVSRIGLVKLLEWMDNQNLPVPGITPNLVYQWRVLYTDGSSLSQFELDSVSGEEKENNSRLIDFTRISQTSIVPRDPVSELPTYTYDWSTNTIYRNGAPIQTEYPKERHADAQVFCKRRVTHTWGSHMGQGLDREIVNAHTTVLYLMGWHTWENGPCCIISVDERGNWRPWLYN